MIFRIIVAGCGRNVCVLRADCGGNVRLLVVGCCGIVDADGRLCRRRGRGANGRFLNLILNLVCWKQSLSESPDESYSPSSC